MNTPIQQNHGMHDERWPHDEVLHAWWVEPGRLLAGEYPGDTTTDKAKLKLQLLVDAGVDSMISLTSADEGLPSYAGSLHAVAERANRTVRYTARPIPDMRAADQRFYDDIVTEIQTEINEGKNVYVHCWQGIGRTGTVVGCWLIDHGLDYKATITRLAELRAGTRKGSQGCRQSAAQHQLLHDRARRRSAS
jgi:predicted protein tyrosine phosphatase